MKGSTETINRLNEILTTELTAINQYFLHARILQDWGLEEIGKKEYEASIDEMKHADELIKRILFLEGLPNVQKLNKVNIGQNIEEILKSDLNLEMQAVPFLRDSIQMVEKERDYVTRELLQKILESEEEHVHWLEMQLELLHKVGVQNYLQSQIS